MGAVPGVDRVLQVSYCRSKSTGIFLVAPTILDARIGARMGRPGRADGDDGAGADFANALAMGVAVDWSSVRRIVSPPPSSDTPVVTPKRSRSRAASRASARQNSGVEADR